MRRELLLKILTYYICQDNLKLGRFFKGKDPNDLILENLNELQANFKCVGARRLFRGFLDGSQQSKRRFGVAENLIAGDRVKVNLGLVSTWTASYEAAKQSATQDGYRTLVVSREFSTEIIVVVYELFDELIPVIEAHIESKFDRDSLNQKDVLILPGEYECYYRVGGAKAPSSHTTVRTDPYTAVCSSYLALL